MTNTGWREQFGGQLAKHGVDWQRLSRYPRALALAQEVKVGSTPCDLVLERGSHRLLRYRRESPARFAEPLLLCYALVNRPYILDLQPDKSVVRRYLDRGFEVYIIDWGVPRLADRDLGIDHYVCGFLDEAVQRILDIHRLNQLHLFGYCMGGTLAVLFTALQPARVKALTLLAAPIDFAVREVLLNLWVERFDVDAFLDAHGNCPAWFLQACFQVLKPVQNYLQKNLSLHENLEDAQFLSNYFAMELWINDNIPVAGATFRAFVKELYQENRLVRGEFRLAGQRVDLRRICGPLLLLTASKDHLVAPASTEGIRPHLGSREVQSISLEAGHVGLVVSGKAQKTLWPQATSWLADRSTCSTTGTF